VRRRMELAIEEELVVTIYRRSDLGNVLLEIEHAKSGSDKEWNLDS
jgi:hypothetical protein